MYQHVPMKHPAVPVVAALLVVVITVLVSFTVSITLHHNAITVGLISGLGAGLASATFHYTKRWLLKRQQQD